MEINIYNKYNVHYRNNYSYLNEEKEFEKDFSFWSKVMQGGELLDFISVLLKDEYLIKFESWVDFESYMEFENFNPDTGEGSTITLEYILEKEE